MNKPELPEGEELRPEYVRSDFGDMVRGKYAAKLYPGRMVALDADLAAAFPTDRAVNDALRAFLAAGKALDLPK
jgi:hypothetical protein